MKLDYFIIGHLHKNNKPVCTCIAGREERPGGRVVYWNMRGGLEYMRRVEIYPCHIYPSIKAMQDAQFGLYSMKPWSEPDALIFKACEPEPVTI